MDLTRHYAYGQLHEAIAGLGDARRALDQVREVHLQAEQHAMVPLAGPTIVLISEAIDLLTAALAFPMGEASVVVSDLDEQDGPPVAALSLAAYCTERAMATSNGRLRLDHVLAGLESSIEHVTGKEWTTRRS